MTTTAPLTSDDHGYRPFPRNMHPAQDNEQPIYPELVEPFMLNGKGWYSQELSELLRDFGRPLVMQACGELGLDARRTNINELRKHLQDAEDQLK
jgi:hypothetical protein